MYTTKLFTDATGAPVADVAVWGPRTVTFE